LDWSLPVCRLSYDGIRQTDIRSAEAGLKYSSLAVRQRFYSLWAEFHLWHGGTTSLTAISEGLAAQSLSPLLFAGIVMTFVGFAFKIAAAPFISGRPTPTKAGRFRAPRLLHQDQK